MRIYTLGTAEISEAGFSKIFSKYQIQVVADIRLSTTLHPTHLKREDVQRLCRNNRVEYIYLGNELGSDIGSGRFSSVDPDLYRRGVNILQSLARTRGLLILGSPRNPERCNRRKIADELAKEGAEVLHLLDVETIWDPSSRPELPLRPRARGGRKPRFDNRHGKKGRDKRHRKDSPHTRSYTKDQRPPLKKKTGRSKMDKAHS